MEPAGARQGKFATLHGEVVRIAGRVCYEIYNNGGVNWGRSFTALLGAVRGHPLPGLPMSSSFAARAEVAVASLKGRTISHQAVDGNHVADGGIAAPELGPS